MMVIAAIVLPGTSWRVVWLVAAAAAALMAVALLLRAVPRQELDPLPVPQRSVLAEMKEVGTNGGPLAIGVCFGAYACCWFAIIGFLPTLLIERLGYSTSAAAIITAVVAILNVAGNLAAGWLLHRGVRRVTVIVGATLSMSLCAAGIFVSGVPDLDAAGAGRRLFGGDQVVPGALFTAIPVHAPRRELAGASTGLLMQGSNIGGLLGPPIAGVLVAGGGWPSAAWLTTGALALAAAAGLFLHLARKA